MNLKVVRVIAEGTFLTIVISAVVMMLGYSIGYDKGQLDLKNDMNDFGYFEARGSILNEETNQTETVFQKMQLEVYAKAWCTNQIRAAQVQQ